MDDLMNDSDVLFGKGVDLGLLTGSQGAGSLDEMGGIGRMGDGMGNIMDQDLKDLKDLLQERIWTVMEWLLHLHLMIQLTMWSKD